MNIRTLKLIATVTSIYALTSCSPSVTEQPDKLEDLHAETGVLPPWKQGALDIHFINTGTGESSFIIMPDGTQKDVQMFRHFNKTLQTGNFSDEFDKMKELALILKNRRMETAKRLLETTDLTIAEITEKTKSETSEEV